VSIKETTKPKLLSDSLAVNVFNGCYIHGVI